jgi:hypothetical protein
MWPDPKKKHCFPVKKTKDDPILFVDPKTPKGLGFRL